MINVIKRILFILSRIACVFFGICASVPIIMHPLGLIKTENSTENAPLIPLILASLTFACLSYQAFKIGQKLKTPVQIYNNTDTDTQQYQMATTPTTAPALVEDNRNELQNNTSDETQNNNSSTLQRAKGAFRRASSELQTIARGYPAIPKDVLDLMWFYDGKLHNLNDLSEPSLIISSLDVAKGPTAPIGYYPSFQEMNPFQRYEYLEWLRSVEQETDISYVFTFYYGLERHIVNGKYREAVKMIRRLKLSHDNNSFQAYSNSALIYAAIKYNDVTFLDGILFDYLSSSALLTIRYIFYGNISVDDIISCNDAIGFLNKRYIRSEYQLFRDTLSDLIGGEYYSFTIPKNFELEKMEITPLANFSLNYLDREFSIPDVLSHKPTETELYTLLFQTHEIVKEKLKVRRRDIADKYKKSTRLPNTQQ